MGRGFRLAGEQAWVPSSRGDQDAVERGEKCSAAGDGHGTEGRRGSRQGAPEEELVERKPSPALKINNDLKNGTVPSVWRGRTGRGGLGLGLVAT